MDHNGIVLRFKIVAGISIVAGVLFVLFFDIGPVDDSDLVLPPREVDPAQNPYPEIRDLELSAEAIEEFYRINGMMVGTEAMDPVFLLEMLERHRPLLERFQRYAAMEDWQQDAPLHGFASGTNPMTDWKGRAAPLLVAESVRLAATSQPTAAVDANLSLLRFAAGLQTAEILMLDWTMACTIRLHAYRGLLALIDRNALGATDLERISETMKVPRIQSMHIDRVIRAEYAVSRTVSVALVGDPRGPATRWIPVQAIYKENRTVRGLAEASRRVLRLSETTLLETRRHYEATDFFKPPKGFSKWIEFLGGNAQGQDLVLSIESYLLQTVEYSFIHRAHHELLRTRVALERYRLDHGTWPPDLAALVPGYLDAVPLDPIDGKPLRYDLESRLLYSIGDNLIDEQGVAPDHSGSLRSIAEIVIELEPENLVPWPDFSELGSAPE